MAAVAGAVVLPREVMISMTDMSTLQ
jgi:hypothetical protein